MRERDKEIYRGGERERDRGRERKRERERERENPRMSSYCNEQLQYQIIVGVINAVM